MRKFSLQLTPHNQTTQEVTLNEGEDYLLIQLSKFNTDQFLNAAIKIGEHQTLQTAKCTGFVKFNVFGSSSFQLNSNLAGNDTIEGEINMGSWADMMLVALSKNLNFFYQSCNKDESINFQIGLNDYANLMVTSPDAQHYELTRKLITTDARLGEKKITVLKTSDTGKLIEDIYQQIKKNLQDDNFTKLQQQQRQALQQNMFEFY
jgi:hypothetical protein